MIGPVCVYSTKIDSGGIYHQAAQVHQSWAFIQGRDVYESVSELVRSSPGIVALSTGRAGKF